MIDRPCEHCGAPIRVYPCRVRAKLGRFCSLRCSTDHRIGCKPGQKNTAEMRFWQKVSPGAPDECWPWAANKTRLGYGHMYVDGRQVSATHLALELHGMPRPSTAHNALHKCDNPPCVNPAHLWWGTLKENSEDCARKGRYTRHTSKLTVEQVVQIRALCGKETQTAIGKLYNVSPSTVRDIHQRLSWRSVP